jgi:hypothetical protein
MLNARNTPLRPPLRSPAQPLPKGSGFGMAVPALPGDGRDPVFAELDERIRQEERQERAKTRKARRKTRARRPSRYARVSTGGKSSATRKRAPRKPSEAFTAAKQIALRAAAEIRSQFGNGFSRDDCQRLANAFRSGIVTKRKPGRGQKAHITAALADWKAGMRGDDLCRTHIRGWDRHSIWRRKQEAKMLMDAIRSRRRRDNQNVKGHIVNHDKCR